MKGWATRPLGETCQIRPPKSEASRRLSDEEMVSFVPMEDMGVDQKHFIPTQSRPLNAVSGSYTFFADGDVLMAKITPCFENGKLGIATGLINGIGFGSSEYLVFRPTKVMDKEWLYYVLSRSDFRSEGAERMTGAVGHKRVPKEFIEAYPIPVPPLQEQGRIVGILDQAFDGIATAKANAEKNLQNARAIFESHRDALLTNQENGWDERPLADLCEVKHGFAFKSENFTESGDFILLTPGNFFETGGYRDRGEKQKYYNGIIPDGFILSEGDLLVAMTEQAAGLLGSPILVPNNGKFLHNQRLGLVVNKPRVPWENKFFFHVFNLHPVRKAIHDSATGVKVRHTSPTKIGEVVVRFPPSKSEQLSIVSEIDGLNEQTICLEGIYQKKITALDDLKKSLLDQAFTGNL